MDSCLSISSCSKRWLSLRSKGIRPFVLEGSSSEAIGTSIAGPENWLVMTSKGAGLKTQQHVQPNPNLRSAEIAERLRR